MTTATSQQTSVWTAEDAAALYGVPSWGKGYFRVSDAGRILVTPTKQPERSIDLYDLVEGLKERGIWAPVLLRFTDILRHRIEELSGAFREAMRIEGYTGAYRCVYPIKVNQQRHVVEEIRDIGGGLGFGLEAGSKPELLAVLGMTSGLDDMPIVCNGFKDDEFIEMVILATKLGRWITPVVEKFSELELLVKHAKAYGVRPSIGVRVKVAAKGVGRWESSGGERSKFGLFMSELLSAMDYLKKHDMADCLRMVHFHIGSQVCDIRNMKNALTELAHVYTELRRLGATKLDVVDVGGGLGVDYDGSQTAFESSMNYTVQEYAADVVHRIKSVCDDVGAPHPTIITESGRAMAAYSSVLVFEVVGSAKFDAEPEPDELEAALAAEQEVPQPVIDLMEVSQRFNGARKLNLLEAYHDAVQGRDEAMSLFSMGYISLPMRAIAERLYWAIGKKILQRASGEEELPEELRSLPIELSDTFFCNMSVFQSIPDSWAIDQLFPICPIHRLGEEPLRRGVLADITCDSDGGVKRFVDLRDVKGTLELHDLRAGEPYYLAAFLVGAYQEILGDLHNLLGDTHAVHVTIDKDGEASIDEVVEGDTVKDVLGYVQIDHRDLRRSMRRDVERAVKLNRLTVSESRSLLRFYEDGLDGYTYLE